jgi:hypothetical protein
MHIDDMLRGLLQLPADQQVNAAREFLSANPAGIPEEWNSAFGPRSLFDAWCKTSVAQAVHRGVREAIAPALRDDFVLIEVGGGDGSTWRGAFQAGQRGTIHVVDPVSEAAARVREVVPESIQVVAHVASVQDATLPDADGVVCSLTLHHVAGRDASQRAAYGMTGPGKTEVLERFGDALRAKRGLGVLVEADVDCDLEFPPGDPLLTDHIFDSYVRRCARSILEDLQSRQAPAELQARWRGLLRHWFLGQIAVADLPREQRDVYELTVPNWMALLHHAGLNVREHAFTDDLPLFHRYIFTP